MLNPDKRGNDVYPPFPLGFPPLKPGKPVLQDGEQRVQYAGDTLMNYYASDANGDRPKPKRAILTTVLMFTPDEYVEGVTEITDLEPTVRMLAFDQSEFRAFVNCIKTRSETNGEDWDIRGVPFRITKATSGGRVTVPKQVKVIPLDQGKWAKKAGGNY